MITTPSTLLVFSFYEFFASWAEAKISWIEQVVFVLDEHPIAIEEIMLLLGSGMHLEASADVLEAPGMVSACSLKDHLCSHPDMSLQGIGISRLVFSNKCPTSRRPMAVACSEVDRGTLDPVVDCIS